MIGRAPISFSIGEGVAEIGVAGCYFEMSGMRNGVNASGLSEMLEAAVAEVVTAFPEKASLADDPTLVGFRDLHTAVGRSNRDNVSSSENLIRAVQRTGTVPRVNNIVDAYNLVSLQSRLALGAHDAQRVAGKLRLGITNGQERFVPLGQSEPKPVYPGEYAYMDDEEIICRMEVRQVEKTKVTLETSSCFYIVQGNARTPAGDILKTAESLIRITQEFCGGESRFLHRPV